MKKIILIAGLPASGKTHYAKEILADGILIDDPKSWADFPKNFDRLVITDPFLCISKNREICEKWLNENYSNINIEWIFFENNPIQCLKNAKYRENKKVDNFIKQLSSKYIIPHNSNVIKVYESK